MSSERPIYEQLRRRGRWMGRLWVAGEIGYYLGIVLAVAAFSMAVAIPPVAWLARVRGEEEQFAWYWRLFEPSLIALPIFIAIATASGFLQAYLVRLTQKPTPDSPHQTENKQA